MEGKKKKRNRKRSKKGQSQQQQNPNQYPADDYPSTSCTSSEQWLEPDDSSSLYSHQDLMNQPQPRAAPSQRGKRITTFAASSSTKNASKCYTKEAETKDSSLTSYFEATCAIGESSSKRYDYKPKSYTDDLTPGTIRMVRPIRADPISIAEVQLYVYELSQGMVENLSEMFTGKKYDGIWHTSIVVFEKEFYYGIEGIITSPPGETWYGTPNEKLDLGITDITEIRFLEQIRYLGRTTFAPDKYSYIQHNSNTFSNELSQFLVNKNIPQKMLTNQIASDAVSHVVNKGLRMLNGLTEVQSQNQITRFQTPAASREPSTLELLGTAAFSFLSAAAAIAETRDETTSSDDEDDRIRRWQNRRFY